LEVRKSNLPAIKLYKKLGFVEAGIRKDFYTKPLEDAIIMWKTSIH
jgi:ribosomal-protein-alanine N-acetyltransferase